MVISQLRDGGRGASWGGEPTRVAFDDGFEGSIFVQEAELILDRGQVRAEWIDENGHMNVAYYVKAVDLAVDHFCEAVGLSELLRQGQRHSIFAAEIHVAYKRELLPSEDYFVTLQIVGLDEKRIHWFWRIYHEQSGQVAATMEGLTLSVDLTTRRVAPWHPDTFRRMKEIADRQASLPQPKELGRVIAMRRQA